MARQPHPPSSFRTSTNIANSPRTCAGYYELGVDGFVAHTTIEPSRVWQDKIEYALNTSDVLVGLLHLGFAKSIWTQQEMGWVLGRAIRTLMVRLGEDPNGFCVNFQASAGKS